MLPSARLFRYCSRRDYTAWVKTTCYFRHVRERPDRSVIEDAWILRVIGSPLRREVQSDGRFRLWGRIEEVGKVLRVIVLEDGETVHNAFFDRGYKEE